MDPAIAPPLGPWSAGNTGVAGVWSFGAEAPGPHVMINALTHGNEPCGARALLHLLGQGVRPGKGRLTLSFANLAAYDAFRDGSARPGRFLDRDLNRLWRDDWIDADADSREARRARELRPAVAAADILLDLHSTATVARPFYVLADLAKTRALAEGIAWPPTLQLMPGGCAEGRHLIDYGRFDDPADPAVALTLECGRHGDAVAGDTAIAAAIRFLEVVGTLAPGALAGGPPRHTGPGEIFRTGEPYVVATDRYRFTGRTDGFYSVTAGEPVAMEGDEPVLAPYDATIVSPRPAPRRGEVAFLWCVRVNP